ncbi:VCBS repeat-containing protein [Pelagicoccus mobilis]|uniref:VCBS repeat-containing protein n=1 Tax=Pelagicoccus mobilis TaxID=415221 RepID=A0A934RZ49_9BACT|nr:VCBS repeat-containing protein [Pelagicoccus mobilis]MBK1879407.1 VCBS repeat-containing protein [Pelagicoccus mobilis]
MPSIQITVILFFLTAVRSAFGEGILEIIPFTDDGRSEGRFVQVESGYSGVSHLNEYNHPERWTRLWHQYFLGTIGAGVALGDVDGDGFADIFAVGKDSENRLYLNKGGFQFSEEASERGILSLGKIGAGVSMLDIDNDGDLDIYATYTGFPNELYINDGKGVFVESAVSWGLDIETGSNAPSFADYDRDGDLDLYLQCNFLTASGFADGMPDLLFENQNGVFVNVTEAAGISGRGQGHAAVWWDYNEDGWPDLYVANDFEAADRLYLNNQDGTFSDVIGSVLVTSPYSAMGADIGDLDNDGVAELLVGEMATDDPEKHQRTVASIETKSIYASRTTASQYMQNMLSTRIGESQFAEIARMTGLAATDWTWAVRIADLDNDGLQDVYFNNGMIRAFHDGDLGVKSEKARTGWQRMAYFKQAPRYDERNLLYRNLGDFQFQEVGESAGVGVVGVSFSAAFADLDLDGDLDLVTSNMDAPLSVFRNDLATGSSVVVQLKGRDSNRYGIGARLKLHRAEDVLSREMTLTRGYLSTDEPVAHFGLGEQVEIDRLEIFWPSGTVQLVRGLKAGNRYLIEEVASEELEIEKADEPIFRESDFSVPSGMASIEEYFRLHPRQMLKPHTDFRSGPPILLRDLNGDGWLDLLLGGATGDETEILWNREGAGFEAGSYELFEDDFDAEDLGLLCEDLDGDGRLEVVVASGGEELDVGDEYYADRVYSLSEDGIQLERWKRSPAFPAMPTASMALVDCDGDGDLDLLAAGGSKSMRFPFHERNVVWRRGDDGFEREEKSDFAEAFAWSGNTSELLSVDWTGDGRPDLVQAVRWGAPRFGEMGDEGLVLAKEAIDEEGLAGDWSSVASGDFDGDGRMDVVLGNRGLNLRHVPSAESPLALFVPTDPIRRNLYVECYTHEGRLLPVESRILHTAQFPGLVERNTRSIEDYAKKDVFEILGSEALDEFTRFEIAETQSLILYQKEPGRFTPEALPRWVQSGQAMDILPLDYDEDGWLDLVFSLEPRAPRLWVDRPLKGHVILLRNMKGKGFEAILPKDSGLEVDGFPRHLAWGDLDGDGRSELLLTLSDGPLRIFSIGAK